MSSNKPLFEEATQKAKDAINGLNTSLFLVKPLAMVFAGGGVAGRSGENSKIHYFPPSLSSVIYAVFHRSDDPVFFNAINKMVAGNKKVTSGRRYYYDGDTQVLKPRIPIDRLPDNKNSKKKSEDPVTRLIKSRAFRNEPEINESNLNEGCDIVAGFLINPNILTDDVGKTFETDLIDVMEYAAPEGMDLPLLERLGKIKERAKADYARGLMMKWVLPDKSKVINNDERINKITDEEIAVFIACHMSEHFADDVLATAESIERAVKPLTDKVALTDVMKYATDWIKSNASLDSKRERRTGDDATDYVPLDVTERNDLINAPVAPEYVIPMFAKDCGRFVTEEMDADMIDIGYQLIARAIGAPSAEPEDINAFIRDELATDTERAKKVRETAINIIAKYRTNPQTTELANRILRHVFQYKNDEMYSKLSGISGAGDEIRHRRTGVAIGSIASKITDIFKPDSGKYMVVADENPEVNGKASYSDKFTVNLDGIEETISREDENMLHNYQRPALVDYNDTDLSYPLYAIWEGIVPYSKMEDNRTTYDIAQSPETVAARKDSLGNLVRGAMGSIQARTGISALGGKVDPTVKQLTRDDIIEVANRIKGLGYSKLFSGIAWEELDDVDLRNYVLVSAIKYYNGALDHYDSNAGKRDESFAFKDAVKRVMGNPVIMMTPMSSDEVVEKIADTYSEYAAAREVSDGDEETVDSIYDAYLTDFFNRMDDNDFTSTMSETYGNDFRSAARDLRAYDKDLLDALQKVASGYGYRGLKLTNTYKGGRYNFNNRLTLNSASFDEPIGDFRDSEATRGIREKIMENVVKPVANGLHHAVGNNAAAANMLAETLETAKAGGFIDGGVADKALKEALDVTGGLDKASATAYAILMGAITGNSMIRKLVQLIDDGSAKAAIYGIRPDVPPVTAEDMFSRLETEGKDFKKAMALLGCIQQLSNGGADFKPIRDILGDENTESNRGTYGTLMSAVDAFRKTAERLGNLEDGTLAVGFVDTGRRQNVGNDVDLEKTAGEEELAQVAANEDNVSNISETVESEFQDWNRTPGYITYHGLTGYMGFDTIMIGESGDSEMATFLASREDVAKGINPHGLIMCARMIDDARNHDSRLSEVGEKGKFYLIASDKNAWADAIINFASTYMLSRITLEGESNEPNGTHPLNKYAAEEWTKLATGVLDEIEKMCTDLHPSGSASIADEILSMIGSIEVNNSTVEDISKVSTALAHMIIKLGEFSDSTRVGDPLNGATGDKVDVPDPIKQMARMRAMPGNTVRGQMSDGAKKVASDFIANVKNSVHGDSDFAKILSNLYDTYGRNTTEGYAGALGAMQAAAHAAGNKTDKVKSKLAGGVAPTNFAGMLYAKMWDSEDANDPKYSDLVNTIASVANGEAVQVPVSDASNEQYNPKETSAASFDVDGNISGEDAKTPVLLMDIIHMAKLDDTVQFGPATGKTYADCGFGDASEYNQRVRSVVQGDPDIGRKLAIALRAQMVDRLLDDKTFNSFRENKERWNQFSNRVSAEALNLNGASSMMLFVTLDHAILNLGREKRQKRIHDALNADAKLGEDYASERMVRNNIGSFNGGKVDTKALSAALLRYIFDTNESHRQHGLEQIRIILGDGPTNTFVDSINPEQLRDDTSDAQHKLICDDLAKNLAETYGQTASSILHAGEEADAKFKSEIRTLRTALRVVATGKPDANGHTANEYENTIIPNMLGDELAKAVLDAFKDKVPEGGRIDPRTIDMLVSHFLFQLLHSTSNVVSRLMKNAGIGVGAKSSVARWNNARESGDVRGHGDHRTENEGMEEAIFDFVEEALANFNVHSDRGERNRLYRRLNPVGFKGSIEEFCNKVLDGEDQKLLAKDFATNPNNYQTAMYQEINGPLSAMTPTKSIADDNAVLAVARGMDRLGLTGVNMVRDADGNEEQMVKFANSDEQRSIRSGYAARQLEILMDMFKNKYGTNLIDADGDVTEDNLRKLADMMRETSVRYPVDPVTSTRELAPIVLNIINNDGIKGGQAWAKKVGGVNGSRIFERTVTRSGAIFNVQIGEEIIINTVRDLVRGGSSEIKSSDIADVIEQLRKFNKGVVVAKINDIATYVKKRIDKRVDDLINTMRNNGKDKLAVGGIKIVWTNPGEVPPPAPKKPKAPAAPKAPKKRKSPAAPKDPKTAAPVADPKEPVAATVPQQFAPRALAAEPSPQQSVPPDPSMDETP